jgi:hypothetical protein
VERKAFAAPPQALGRSTAASTPSRPSAAPAAVDEQQLVEMITDKVMAAMKGK